MPNEYCWPMMRTCLEDYYEMILRCGKCAYCRNVWPSNTQHEKFGFQCPRGERHKFEAYYASGTMEIARGLLEGELKWTDRLLHILYTCTECGACEEWCEVTKRIYPLKVIREMKIKAVKEGKGPMPAHNESAKSINENQNPYMEPYDKRLAWIPEGMGIPKKADLIYFVGCTPSYRTKEVPRATVRMLKNAGIDFGIMPNEWCCGYPLFSTGLVESGIRAMKHNLDAIKEAKAKKVIFTCPGCYKTFKDAPKYGLGELDFEISHITEFLLPLVKEDKFEFKKIEEKLTYHDPCSLGRHLMVYEPPREILTAIPGIELIEMPRNRKNAWCCGGGGEVRAQYYDFAAWTARKRLEEVKHVGVQTLVTACPLCDQHLRIVGSREGIKVYDIVEILSQALEEEKT